MGIDKLSIKLDEAKQIIAIPASSATTCSKIALAALSTLQLPHVSDHERQLIERDHRRLSFLGDRLLYCRIGKLSLQDPPKLN